MGTSLIETRLGSVSALESYADALANLTGAVSEDEGKPILKLKDGRWLLGADKIRLTEKDLLAINPLTIREGWIAFDNKNEIAYTEDDEIADLTYPPGRLLPRDKLPELEQPKRGKPSEWRHQIVIDFMIVAGPNKGLAGVYKPTSTGGRRMASKIIGEIEHRVRSSDDKCVPVISLYSDVYYNKRWEKDVDIPLFTLMEWCGLDDDDFNAPQERDDERGGKNSQAGSKRSRDRDEGEEDNRRGGGRGGRSRDRDEGEEDNRRGGGRGGRSRDRDEGEEDNRRGGGRGGRSRDRDEEDDRRGDSRRSSRRGDEEEEEERGSDRRRGGGRGGRSRDRDEGEEDNRRGGGRGGRSRDRDDEGEEDNRRGGGRGGRSRDRDDEGEEDNRRGGGRGGRSRR